MCCLGWQSSEEKQQVLKNIDKNFSSTKLKYNSKLYKQLNKSVLKSASQALTGTHLVLELCEEKGQGDLCRPVLERVGLADENLKLVEQPGGRGAAWKRAHV